MKILGPYQRKSDRRFYMKVFHEDGRSSTMSYPKWLMEKHLGRELSSDETVDHIDNNVENNNLNNLQVLSLADNIRKSAKPPEYVECICPVCVKQFLALARYVRANQIKQGKAGPYCNKSCAGKMHN
jgi:hypothetical protein